MLSVIEVGHLDYVALCTISCLYEQLSQVVGADEAQIRFSNLMAHSGQTTRH